MPELPEVTTTVLGLRKTAVGKKIAGVWTDWPKMFRDGNFAGFKRTVAGKKIIGASRRAKHVLIHLSGNLTIIIHMKMTGHLLYGRYKKSGQGWVADEEGPLKDPFNRFIHVVFSLSLGKHLAFSDTRKFGKIALAETDKLAHSPHLAHLGPEPLEKNFDSASFAARFRLKPRGRIKTVLMDQTVISGIGNIYSDEILWRAGVHPEARTGKISPVRLKKLFAAMKRVLSEGIDFGGDSTSDYRNVYGEPGEFQEKHHAYQKKGEKCGRAGCGGIIVRKIIGGRSAHFCSKHQKK